MPDMAEYIKYRSSNEVNIKQATAVPYMGWLNGHRIHFLKLFVKMAH
jgi:hypothetical protein